MSWLSNYLFFLFCFFRIICKAEENKVNVNLISIKGSAISKQTKISSESEFGDQVKVIGIKKHIHFMTISHFHLLSKLSDILNQLQKRPTIQIESMSCSSSLFSLCFISKDDLHSINQLFSGFGFVSILENCDKGKLKTLPRRTLLCYLKFNSFSISSFSFSVTCWFRNLFC